MSVGEEVLGRRMRTAPWRGEGTLYVDLLAWHTFGRWWKMEREARAYARALPAYPADLERKSPGQAAPKALWVPGEARGCIQGRQHPRQLAGGGGGV